MPRTRLIPLADLKKVVVLPTFFAALAVLAGLALAIRGEFASEREHGLRSKASQLAGAFQTTLSPTLSGNELTQHLQTLAGTPDVKWLLVWDAQTQRPVASATSNPKEVPGGTDLDRELALLLPSWKPLEGDSFVLAKDAAYLFHPLPAQGGPGFSRFLIIAFKPAFLGSSLQPTLVLTLLLLGAMLVLLAVSYLSLHRFVILPLKALHSDLVAEPESDKTVELVAPIEIQEVACVLNQTLDENHRAQEALKAHLETLKFQRFAFDQHAIVDLSDLQGNLTYANDRFYYLCGYSRDEILGKSHRLLNSGYHPKAYFAGLYRTIEHGGVWHGEIRNRSKNGVLYWVDTTIVPRLGNDGKPQQYLALRTDITSLKRVEAEIEEARDAAEAANQAKSDFLATISHEIRTPMNGIVGFTDVLLESYLDENQRGQALVIKRSAENLLVLISDILDYSKIEAGKVHLECLPFDLPQNLRDALLLLAPKAREKHLDLDVEFEAGVPVTFNGDPVRLRQIVLNLVSNAVKFTDIGRILVKVSACGEGEAERLRIEVSDTGIGITPEQGQRLFERFNQADNSMTRKYGGTGLGLAICRSLVELMEGSIEFSSTPGQGSRFWFTVPNRHNPENTVERTTRQTLRLSEFPMLTGKVERRTVIEERPTFASLAETPKSGVRPKHVLIVDDNEANRMLAAAFLRKLQCTYEEAVEGESAVPLMQSGRFDLVLMDCHMPVKDGCIATMDYRITEPVGTHLPIIALSASPEDRERCLLAGMDDFLAKPLRKEELRRVVEASPSAHVA